VQFNEPVTAMKQTLSTVADTERRPHQRVHASFQSFSSANVSTTNALNSNKLFVFKESAARVSVKEMGHRMEQGTTTVLEDLWQN
jgi:hypothetical protein